MKKTVILVPLILVALGSIYFTTFRGMPTPNRQPYVDLGKSMAEETAKLTGNGGRIAIIINQEFGGDPIPSLDVEMKAFLDALKQKGITVEGIEKVPMQKVGLAQAGAFVRAIEKRKDVDAIVSVVGFPMSPGQNPAVFKSYKAKFIVAAPYEPGLKKLLQEEIIQIAILPKFAPPSGNVPPAKNFDGGFQVITPKDAAGLP